MYIRIKKMHNMKCNPCFEKTNSRYTTASRKNIHTCHTILFSIHKIAIKHDETILSPLRLQIPHGSIHSHAPTALKKENQHMQNKSLMGLGYNKTRFRITMLTDKAAPHRTILLRGQKLCGENGIYFVLSWRWKTSAGALGPFVLYSRLV